MIMYLTPCAAKNYFEWKILYNYFFNLVILQDVRFP